MVAWTPEKDQKILKGVFRFCDIKNSKPLLEYLAAAAGEGCTPKAVAHRLSNLRNSGKMVGKSPGSGRKTAVATSRTHRTSKAPASFGLGKGSAEEVNDDYVNTDEAIHDNEMPASPLAGRKRARASKTPKTYAESDAADDDSGDEFVPATKRVKEEPMDDTGFAGLTTKDAPAGEEEELEAFV